MAALREIRINNTAFKVTRKHGEYVVEVYELQLSPTGSIGKVPINSRFYYTSNAEDAQGTMKAMVKEELENILRK